MTGMGSVKELSGKQRLVGRVEGRGVDGAGVSLGEWLMVSREVAMDLVFYVEGGL